MIDGVKFITRVNHDEFIKNPFLEFNEVVSIKTGLIQNFKESKYFGLTFKLFDIGTLIVSGSIHKYWNFKNNIKGPNQLSNFEIQKGFNGNDFSMNDARNTLKDIAAKFNLDLNQCQLQNIEIGLNITHSLDTNQILNGLMLHKGVIFNRLFENSYTIAEHQRYYFKIYNKGAQYGLIQPTIRIELKYKKMNDLNLIGINNLNDLFKSDNAIKMFNVLLYEFEKVLLYDYTIDAVLLDKNQIVKIKDYSNSVYWITLKPIRRDKPKKMLESIINQFSQNIKNQIRILMKSKFESINESKQKRVRFNPLDKRLIITPRILSKVEANRI